MSFFLDLSNIFICLLSIIILLRLNIIPVWIGFILMIQSFIPYFLNDLLFPASYMSDQFRYSTMMSELRSFNFSYQEDYKVSVTTWILSFLPLPFAETIKSIGFYNRFMFIMLFTWLYKKNFLSGISLYMLLFYPSLLLYTSLSLRDPLIMTLMIISVILFIDKKYLKSFIITIPLFFIKFQNFFLIMVFYVIFFIFKKNTVLFKLRYFILLSLILIILPFLEQVILLLNYYRGAMFREDGGDMLNFVPMSGVYDLIILGITSAPYFLLKPFVWEAKNAFQLIQSIENMIIFLILCIFSIRAYRQNSFITIKWLTVLFFSLLIYGLVVFNFGTAVRYKFPFIVLYVVGLSYELYKIQGYRLKGLFKSSKQERSIK